MRAALVGVVAACATGTTTVPFDSEVELKRGSTVMVGSAGVTVTFDGVRSDSRCPRDVTCVWAGNAVAAFRFRSSVGDTVVALSTGVEPRTATIMGVVIELRNIAPYPVSTTSIPPDRYRAIFITRSAP